MLESQPTWAPHHRARREVPRYIWWMGWINFCWCNSDLLSSYIYIYITWETHCLLSIWKSKPTPKPMICGAGRVAEQGGRTLRLLICGAGRVAEQGGRTSRLLICGAGRVAEQGGRTLRLLICGAGRVAEQGGRTLRLFICGAGRVAEQDGRTLRLLICGAGRVAEQGWGGMKTIDFWCLTGGWRGY